MEIYTLDGWTWHITSFLENSLKLSLEVSYIYTTVGQYYLRISLEI